MFMASFYFIYMNSHKTISKESYFKKSITKTNLCREMNIIHEMTADNLHYVNTTNGKYLSISVFLISNEYEVFIILYIGLKPPFSAPNHRYFLHKLHLVNYLYFSSFFIWRTFLNFVYTLVRPKT